jgi:uncharacterized OB-fold protein
MKEYNKPLPQPTPWSKPFWEGCKRNELLIQKCEECHNLIMYPKLFCPHCLSPNLQWEKSSGKGKIYSYSVVHAYAPTAFSKDVPYIVAVVELDEGVRMMSSIVQCNPEEIQCDIPVEVVFEKVTDEITLPKFKPR